MKDDDILKILQDLRSDNIRQERELFKHIAILSSAILAFFAAFNGGNDIDPLAKIAISFFVGVIVISVVIIFFIIRLEGDEINRIQKAAQDTRKIKQDVWMKIFWKVVNKDNLPLARRIFNFDETEDDRIAEEVEALLANCYQDIISGDLQIEAEKEKTKKELEKRGTNRKRVYITLSWIGIAFFLSGVLLILFDVILK